MLTITYSHSHSKTASHEGKGEAVFQV